MKRVLFFLMVLFSVCILVSCSGKKDSASAGGAGSGDYYNENFAKKISLTWYGGPDAPIDDNSWGELEIERLFNLDLTVVRADREGVFALFASGNIPDYIYHNSTTIAAMDSMGVIGEIPVEKIKEFMPTQYEIGIGLDPNVFTYSMVNGRNMAIPRYAYGAATAVPVIRADWLKKVGKPIPKTLQEYEDVLLAFRNNDPDGNGRKDTYGTTSFFTNESQLRPRAFSSIFGAYGVNPYYWRVAANGNVEFGFTTDEFLSALKTLRRWYQMEIIDPEFLATEFRTSGEDFAYKFANGRIGMMESYNMEDYQIDNDGHVSAKWTSANEEWRKFYADNAGNDEVLYQYDVPRDFVDNFLEPYYIALDPPIGPNGKSGAYKENVIGARICVGKQIENEPEKLERILRLLEVMVVDPEVKLNFLGPEEHGQWLRLADGTIINNPNMRDNPMYHPQGILDGSSWFFWPIWFNDKLWTELIGGPRNEQRQIRLLPNYKGHDIQDAVQGVLPSATDYSDLLSDYVVNYITQAIRGDVNIDATYPRMKADWFARGGTKLTEEANEWYRSSRQ